MLIDIILILGILFLSLKIQNIYKIPNPLSIVVLTFLTIFLYPDFISFTNMDVFSEEMLAFIVLLVLVDAFIIKLKDLKEHWLSILYLAGISVVLSILFGILLFNTFFEEYQLSIGALIVLFSMTLATDPVAVVATFKQYNLPHKLKFLAEGESLFNDAFALIMFNSFGIYLMLGNTLTVEYAVSTTFSMLALSTVIGLGFGILGILIMKTVKDTMLELIGILFIAYITFYAAEHYHMSGLLAEIVAIITMTSVFELSYKFETNNSNKSFFNQIKILKDITDKKRQEDIGNFLQFLAIFVNVMLFASLTRIIDINLLLTYWKEILIMFIVTTIIRMIMMGKFAFISMKVNKITNIDFKSWAVLLFSGIKGGLSIVMLHILMVKYPEYEHLEMFTAIVSGVILLSLFVYVIGLMIVISKNKFKFAKEAELEEH